MWRRLIPNSVRARIMLCTALATAAIAAVTVAVCFTVFQSFLRQNQFQSAEYNLQVASSNISADLNNILSLNEWCCSNQDISRYLEAFCDQSSMPSIASDSTALRASALHAYELLKEKYYSTRSFDYISQVLISPSNRRNYLQISSTTFAAGASQAAERLWNTPFFGSVLNDGRYVWNGLWEDPFQTDGRRILPVARPVYSQYGTRITGWAYLAISDRLITSYLSSFPLESDASLYITIGSHTYRLQEGRLTDSDFSYQMLSDLSDETFDRQSGAFRARLADGSRRYLLTAPLGSQGWAITQVLSERSYQAQSLLYGAIIGVIVLAIGLLGLALYAFLSRTINRPVARLKTRIAAISEGDFSPDPSIEGEDEFGAIGRGINHMSAAVLSLMDKKVETEKQKKDLEYQILQSQINPHFLYNTLNSIKWMATIQNAPGIAEMTTSLARLMKNVAKGTQARIPLREELALVKDYFLIQQYRYGGSISIEYQIASEELYDCLIHRFTLQPIVENALFHGIEPKGCAGRIVICVRTEEDGDGRRLILSVTDNGIGMSEETIRRVLSGQEEARADFFRQVGINNVNKRIQYEYGSEYGISIKSVPGEYTTMIITLPCVMTGGDQK